MNATIAQQIRGWRSDIALMAGTPRHETAILAYAWNWATDSKAIRTDRESRALRTFARTVRRRLGSRPGWFESHSGRLVPLP